MIEKDLIFMEHDGAVDDLLWTESNWN